jgi:hypothetical protein
VCLASFPLERLSWPWRARGGRLRAQPIQAMSIAEERAVDARRAALPRPLSSCMPTGGDLTLANLAELRLRGGSSVPGLGAGPAGGLWAAERDQGILAWQLAAAATGPSWVRAGDLAACMAGGLAGGLAGCDAGGATAGLAGWRPQAAAEQHAEAPGGRDLQGAAAALAAWNGGRAPGAGALAAGAPAHGQPAVSRLGARFQAHPGALEACSYTQQPRTQLCAAAPDGGVPPAPAAGGYPEALPGDVHGHRQPAVPGADGGRPGGPSARVVEEVRAGAAQSFGDCACDVPGDEAAAAAAALSAAGFALDGPESGSGAGSHSSPSLPHAGAAPGAARAEPGRRDGEPGAVSARGAGPPQPGPGLAAMAPSRIAHPLQGKTHSLPIGIPKRAPNIWGPPDPSGASGRFGGSVAGGSLVGSPASPAAAAAAAAGGAQEPFLACQRHISSPAAQLVDHGCTHTAPASVTVHMPVWQRRDRPCMCLPKVVCVYVLLRPGTGLLVACPTCACAGSQLHAMYSRRRGRFMWHCADEPA